MELLSIISKDEQANGMAPKNGAILQLASIAATFSDIMKKTGSLQQSDAGSFAEHAELLAPSQRSDTPPSIKDDPYDRHGDVREDGQEHVGQTQNQRDDAAPRRAESDDASPQDRDSGNGDHARQGKDELGQQNADAGSNNRPQEKASSHGDTSAQANEARLRQGDDTAQPVPGDGIATTLIVADGALSKAAAQTAGAASPADAGPSRNANRSGEHGLDLKAKAASGPMVPQTAPSSEGDNADAGATPDKTAQQSAALMRALGGETTLSPESPLGDEAPIVGDRPVASTAPSTTPNNDASRPGQPTPTTAAVNLAAAQGLQQAAAQIQATQQVATNQQATGDAKAAAQVLQNTAATSNQASGSEAVLNGQRAANGDTAPTQRTSSTHAPQAPRFVAAGPSFSEQISAHISKAAADGLDRIDIQLRPAELGRIQVQINVNAGGQVSATVTADNKTTLELLQRDAKGLEQALQSAGLDVNSGDLTFKLRERQDQGQPDSGNRLANLVPDGPAVEEPPLEELLNPAYRGQGIRADGRIDILT